MTALTEKQIERLKDIRRVATYLESKADTNLKAAQALDAFRRLIPER
jgi:hypothetical protein